MGEVTPYTSERRIEVRVEGTAGIKEVSLIKNNANIFTHLGKSKREEFVYIDRVENLPPKGKPKDDYYYVRVLQEDNELAWSSPIWVRGK